MMQPTNKFTVGGKTLFKQKRVTTLTPPEFMHET